MGRFVAPVYVEDTQVWETIRAERDYLTRYFRQIGQELIVDEAEGYSFIRQIELDGEERVPRIGRRQTLGYTATILLVCLRDRKSTRLNSSHRSLSRMPSSA